MERINPDSLASTLSLREKLTLACAILARKADAHMDAMPLYDDVAWLPDWPGIPTGDSEGRIISEALGQKRAILPVFSAIHL